MGSTREVLEWAEATESLNNAGVVGAPGTSNRVAALGRSRAALSAAADGVARGLNAGERERSTEKKSRDKGAGEHEQLLILGLGWRLRLLREGGVLLKFMQRICGIYTVLRARPLSSTTMSGGKRLDLKRVAALRAPDCEIWRYSECPWSQFEAFYSTSVEPRSFPDIHLCELCIGNCTKCQILRTSSDRAWVTPLEGSTFNVEACAVRGRVVRVACRRQCNAVCAHDNLQVEQ